MTQVGRNIRETQSSLLVKRDKVDRLRWVFRGSKRDSEVVRERYTKRAFQLEEGVGGATGLDNRPHGWLGDDPGCAKALFR